MKRNSLETSVLNFLQTCYPRGKSSQEISRAIGLSKGIVGKVMAHLETTEEVIMKPHRWDDGSVIYLWSIK